MAMTTMIHLVDCAYKCSFSFVDISWILCPDLFGMLFAFSSQLQFRCTLSLQMFSWFQARVVFLMHAFFHKASSIQRGTSNSWFLFQWQWAKMWTLNFIALRLAKTLWCRWSYQL